MGEYPTEEELQAVKEYPDAWRRPHEFMGLVRGLWWIADWGFHRDGEKYSLSTGGWSGNEELIDAMQANVMFWACYWSSSRRGGHYEFDISLVKRNKPKSETESEGE